jgi:hypothetical protein
MSAVFWKELRELWIGTLAALAVAVLVGLILGHNAHHDVVFIVITGLGFQACVFAAWQVGRDRLAAEDEFLMHRPVSAVRIHVARGLAGLVSVAATFATAFGVACYAAYRAGFDEHGDPIPKWGHRPWWNDVTPSRAEFAMLFAVACWALVRLGGSASRPVVALFLAPTLPFLFLIMIGRTSGIWPPVVVVSAVGVGAVVLGIANAACRRSTRRS